MRSCCGECVFCGSGDLPEAGVCHGKPPMLMLLPVMPNRAQQIASGGQAQGIALQALRPAIMRSDIACSLFKPEKVN